ncbi:MAG: DUF615 domain-containing protein [Proteobacteria bacterium]|nr:DUF615 domain-containing protein [Pseudomonadota bacterium]
MSRRPTPPDRADAHDNAHDDAHDSAHHGAHDALGVAIDDGSAARPSKSELKRRSQAVQALGLELAGLAADKLAVIEMPETLRAAIDEYRRTKSHEGRRRQLQYVGKLMRDADHAALRQALAAATEGSAHETLALHAAERWRAELIAEDAALARWLGAHPGCDAQHLRSLVRAARRDAAGPAAQARQPRSHRELFRYIKPRVDGT